MRGIQRHATWPDSLLRRATAVNISHADLVPLIEVTLLWTLCCCYAFIFPVLSLTFLSFVRHYIFRHFTHDKPLDTMIFMCYKLSLFLTLASSYPLKLISAGKREKETETHLHLPTPLPSPNSNDVDWQQAIVTVSGCHSNQPWRVPHQSRHWKAILLQFSQNLSSYQDACISTTDQKLYFLGGLVCCGFPVLRDHEMICMELMVHSVIMQQVIF